MLNALGPLLCNSINRIRDGLLLESSQAAERQSGAQTFKSVRVERKALVSLLCACSERHEQQGVLTQQCSAYKAKVVNDGKDRRS